MILPNHSCLLCTFLIFHFVFFYSPEVICQPNLIESELPVPLGEDNKGEDSDGEDGDLVADLRSVNDCGQDEIILFVETIYSPGWNVFKCPEDPAFDTNVVYQSSDNNKDVSKLLTVPYTDDYTINSDYNNHTFWFEFGVSGISYCADDLERINTCEASRGFDEVGVLRFPGQGINYDYSTSVWVNFMTQCDNCFTGEFDKGIWHKDEWYLAEGGLFFMQAISYPNYAYGAEIEVEMPVDCDGFYQYGCQQGELQD